MIGKDIVMKSDTYIYDGNLNSTGNVFIKERFMQFLKHGQHKRHITITLY